MIVDMKKLTFLLTSKEYETFLTDLRDIGLVHVQELQTGTTSPDFEAGLALAERIKKALSVLDYAEKNYHQEKSASTVPTRGDGQSEEAWGKDLLEQIEYLVNEENRLLHERDQIDARIAQLEPWGDFDSDKLDVLAQHGYEVRFFRCAVKAFQNEWKESYYATPISDVDGKTYFITFSAPGVRPDIKAEEMQLPEERLTEYVEKKQQNTDALNALHDSLLAIDRTGRKAIDALKLHNEDSIALSRVHLSTESIAGDAVKMLVGWVPADSEQPVIEYLESHHIYYESERPTLEDDVPVQLKDDKYSSLFSPIMRMYSLPNYHDVDVLPFLAPFFMLFFGLCMGDAGYGLIILGVSIYLHTRLAPEQKSFATLGMFLGGMTMVCGLLTGSFLGIDLSKQDWAFLAPVKDYFVNDNHPIFGYSPMMVVSVIIGFVQVLVGMVLAACKAIKNYGWNYGIGKLSWVVALLSASLLFGLPAFGLELPSAVCYTFDVLIGISVLGIFFYNSPGKNVFLNFGSGLWSTYGMATGLLGDLLSYIRLYALGLTGGVLGGVFNSLAVDMTSSMSWAVRWLPMLIILLLGHGINFGLCMISSFVHPMRLTFVEFFKNADFEGGGKEYNPFRKKSIS